MIFVRYYRRDLVTGEPTQEVDFAIVPYASEAEQHAYCVRAASYRPEAQCYRLFVGPSLREGQPASLLFDL